MAALDYSLIAREATSFLARQTAPAKKPERNWAYRNPGIVLVFAIVFIVGAGLTSLFIYRKLLARKARQQR